MLMNFLIYITKGIVRGEYIFSVDGWLPCSVIFFTKAFCVCIYINVFLCIQIFSATYLHTDALFMYFVLNKVSSHICTTNVFFIVSLLVLEAKFVSARRFILMY